MQIFFNDRAVHCPEHATLADIPALIDCPAESLALALNQTLVHRQRWASTRLSDGDRLDGFSIVAGG